jgi:hypothetical protein
VAVDATGNANPLVTAVTGTPTDNQAPKEVTHLGAQSFADKLVFSWTAPADSDLAGYKVYFNGVATPVELPASQTTYERTGLSAASAYPVRVTAYDTQDNESAGVNLTGYTWLDNPAGLSGEPFSGYVELTWSPVTPTANLKYYEVYVSSAGSFTSIQGMSPAVSTSAAHAKVAGLTNDQTYYFAVVAVNRSEGRRPDVTPISAVPAEDESGPQLTDVQIDGQALVSGSSLDHSSVVTLTADDPAGISRVAFILDGTPLSTDFSAPFACSIDVLSIEDGAHTLEIVAYDTLDNATTLTYTIDVSLAPPAAPAITQPVGGTVTNQPEITVQGQADDNTQVQLQLNGTAVGGLVAVDASGRFSAPLTLAEGENQIRAEARNRSGAGPLSTAITVTLDTSRPLPPIHTAIQALEAGALRLTWNAPGSGKTVVGYYIYRSDAPFSDVAAAERITPQPVNATGYRDLPADDGDWYYRVTSVDDIGSQSDPGQQVTAASDGTQPRLLSVAYTPSGKVDPVSGAMAPGQVAVALTLSEPLMATPFFSIAPQGGLPINVVLTQTSETTYSGSFTITDATPTGTAYAVFSGRDQVGNRGTEIDQGLSFLIDTDGPAIRRLVVSPATPIQNDAQAPVSVNVTIGLDEAVAAGTAPALDYRLSGPGRSAVAITGLTEIAPASGDVQTWHAQSAGRRRSIGGGDPGLRPHRRRRPGQRLHPHPGAQPFPGLPGRPAAPGRALRPDRQGLGRRPHPTGLEPGGRGRGLPALPPVARRIGTHLPGPHRRRRHHLRRCHRHGRHLQIRRRQPAQRKRPGGRERAEPGGLGGGRFPGAAGPRRPGPAAGHPGHLRPVAARRDGTGDLPALPQRRGRNHHRPGIGPHPDRYPPHRGPGPPALARRPLLRGHRRGRRRQRIGPLQFGLSQLRPAARLLHHGEPDR